MTEFNTNYTTANPAENKTLNGKGFTIQQDQSEQNTLHVCSFTSKDSMKGMSPVHLTH